MHSFGDVDNRGLEQAFVLFFGDAEPALSHLLMEATCELLAEGGAKVEKVEISEIVDRRSRKVSVRGVQQARAWLRERDLPSANASLFVRGASRPSLEDEGAKRAYVVAVSDPPWVKDRFGYTGGIVMPASWARGDWLDGWARRGGEIAQSAYIFGTVWPYIWSPSSFLGGATVIPFPEWPAPSDEEQRRTNEWRIQMQDGFRFRDGWLRDVFELSWLNQKQLSMPVFGTSLREWIQQADDRGSLFELPYGFSKWIVAPEMVTRLRRALDPTGLLLAGRRLSVNPSSPQ